MPIQLNEESGGTRLVVHVSGRLAAADYDRLAVVGETTWLTRGRGWAR